MASIGSPGLGNRVNVRYAEAVQAHADVYSNVYVNCNPNILTHLDSWDIRVLVTTFAKKPVRTYMGNYKCASYNIC